MIEKKKVVFLDKDGTIIPDVPYNINPDLISLQHGVIEGLQLLKNEGYSFVVISNQAGVARGYFKYEQLAEVQQKIDSLLQPANLQIQAYYFCPHHPAGKIEGLAIACNCRKPMPGMILEAAKDHNVDLANSWMIGDILNDVEAGNRAGCKTVIINNGNETEWVQGTFRKPTYTAINFLDAAEFICNNSSETVRLNDNKLAAL